MPIVQVHIMEGRSDDQKARMIQKVTDAIAESLDAPTEAVRVLIQEMPKTHFGIGGKTAKELGR